MKLLSISAILLACTATIASAQQYGRTAYADNWSGGAPLPPLGHATYATPTYMQPTYMQPTYIQPQVTYTQPQAYYVAPRTHVVQPQAYYATPYTNNYVQPNPYATRTMTQGYPYQQGPAVTGPATSRCIVSNLNGTQWQDGCAHVRINPADMPHLRQKFSNYSPNSGYVQNLPTDADY